MSRASIGIVRFAFFSFVVASLMFGTRTLLANDGAVAVCDFQPPIWLGTCSSQQECQIECEQYNPQPTLGECSMGCCRCLI